VTSQLVTEALAWVKKGYWVYPVNLTLGSDGKKIPDFPGNWRDSTNDPAELDELFAGSTGIAVDTGKSGIVVIDIDTGHGKDGLRNLTEAGIDLPVTPMSAVTWSGGRHGFFRQPAVRIGSGQNRPVKNVDFRGLGGVVFVAPSPVHDESGEVLGRYAVNGPITAVDDLPVLDESYASRLRLKSSERKPGATTKVRHSTSVREDQAVVLTKFLEGDLDVIRASSDGSRNEALGQVTALLADRCLKLGILYDEYEGMVLEAYRESGGTDENQAVQWCRSGYRLAHDKPLAMPRTPLDDMADQQYARMLAARLARARLNGATSRLVDATSFVDWSEAPPPAQFWVQNVVPQGEQTILFGKPEAGKTFMALDWAMSIACGRTTFGKATTPGKVWFMAGEGNARITSRMHAWMEFHGTQPERSRLQLLNHVPDLMSEEVMEQLAQRVAEDEVDVIFIDTLGRAMAIGGGDISTPPDAAMALRSLQAISKYRPTTTPVVIHHPIKDGGMAGAYNLLGGVDVALQAEAEAGVGVLKFYKNKDGEKTQVCQYRWQKSGASAVLVPAYDIREGPDDRTVPTGMAQTEEAPEESDPFESRRRREESG
jgi:hypothetical protein